MTANQACCECGGGDGASSGSSSSSSKSCTTDSSWTHPKFGDTCADYEPGKKGNKYACDADVKDVCCHCTSGDSSSSSSSSSGGTCVKSAGWTHPKYGDTCDDYAPGGKSAKYACGADVKSFCCSCDEGGSSTSSSGGDCKPVTNWKHPKYGDTCDDYYEGGKSVKYKCSDVDAKKSCCSCESGATKDTSTTDNCQDKLTPDMDDWHDSGGALYDCPYYATPGKNRCAKSGDKYAEYGMTANQACCACGGGVTGGVECTDKNLINGDPFHDSGGTQYDCDYYGKKAEERCGFGNMGDKHEVDGLNANKACCVCGGGDRATEGIEEIIGLTEPGIDTGDDIKFEWVGAKFYNKKHLAGDFIVYWNTNEGAKTVDIALIGPGDWDGNERWIALGFSKSGGMAGSDAVVGWFDENGSANIVDVYLRNQAPSGIISSARQDLTKLSMKKYQNRIIMRFTRPFKPSNKAAAINPTGEFLSLIYSKGKVSAKCKPFCNHESTDRWQSSVAMSAPFGMKLYELNKGLKGEPCQGKARLECADGFSCFHEISLTGDQFAADWENYGVCMDPETLGDDGKDNTVGVQNVFANGGGFENEVKLAGGFVLLFTVDKLSPAGSYGPEDTMTVALISTSPQRQGWIGFGFSPNGLMMGSDVMVGWSNGDTSFVGDYFLAAQVASANVPADKQELTNYRIIKKNGQTAITFQRPLTPADSVQILEGEVHIIYASGPLPEDEDIASGSQFIPYHRYRAMQDVIFVPYSGDYEEANKVGEMGLCGRGRDEIQDIQCKEGLVCFPFPDDFFEVDWSDEMEAATADTSGYTANSEWSDGAGTRADESNPFSDMDRLRGKGVCLTQGQIDAAKDFDFAQVGQAQVIDTTQYSHSQTLRWGFTIYWEHYPHTSDPKKDKISIALLSSIGPGWLGIAFGTKGAMIGSTALCGWKEFGAEENTMVDEYYLNNKLPWEIKSIDNFPEFADQTMQPIKVRIENMGHENAIMFERPLAPSNGFEPIVPGEPTSVLFAVGNVPNPEDQYFGYHRFRDVATVDFRVNALVGRG